MPKRYTVREILGMLHHDGWIDIAQRGSHRQLKHPTKPGRVTVHGKKSHVLAPKTAKSILRQAGLDE